MCVCRERAAKQHYVKFTHNLIKRVYSRVLNTRGGLNN